MLKKNRLFYILKKLFKLLIIMNMLVMINCERAKEVTLKGTITDENIKEPIYNAKVYISFWSSALQHISGSGSSRTLVAYTNTHGEYSKDFKAIEGYIEVYHDSYYRGSSSRKLFDEGVNIIDLELKPN